MLTSLLSLNKDKAVSHPTVDRRIGVELSNLRFVLAGMGEKDPMSGGHRFTSHH
jgi:hypothetical protein